MIDAVTSLVDSLAWPFAAVWIGYLFRSEIRILLGRVSHLKYKDLEAKFELELNEIEAEARKVMLSTQRRATEDEEPIYPPPYDDRYAQLLRIAEESPRVALLEAWVDVEAALSEAAERFKIYTHPHQMSSKTIISLINTGRYAKTVLPLFDSLRGLRNEAAHTPQFQPTTRQIRRYIQIAIELALTFKNPLKAT